MLDRNKLWADLLPVETKSPAETRMLGRRLAPHLLSGDLVALYGNLGAGKTQLVKGICAGLGVPEDQVSSPTFTLVNEYNGSDFPIYHIDAYRIERIEEFFELGYEEYFYGDGLCIIEWPEHVASLLPLEAIRFMLRHTDAGRHIEHVQ
jgi:tRNA threonylcarbamoyladenosine biosynthesis protein TsaE